MKGVTQVEKVQLTIEYTDGEVKDIEFDNLSDCLDYIRQSIIETVDVYAEKIIVVSLPAT